MSENSGLDNIALFDLDGTLCDYDGAIRRDLEGIRGPSDPDYTSFDENMPPYIKERIKLIRNQQGWWEKLDELKLGFDVLSLARELEFIIHILTKGPRSATNAWSEKTTWSLRHVPGAGITQTEDKGLVYGKLLVDDFPGYINQWLMWRPRGLVIMPGHDYNKGFEHLQVVRYDGSNLEQVKEAMTKAKLRKPYEELK